jgi:hypothetical protein
MIKKQHMKWILIIILIIILLFLLYKIKYAKSYSSIENFQPISLNLNDPILLSWLGNYTTGLTTLVPMNKTSPVSGLLQIINNNNTISASYNNITWAIYTYAENILILYNVANTDEQLILKQIPLDTFTKDPAFNANSFKVSNFQNLQFYFIYHRANANASLESISGQDPTNLYDYSLKLFSPLTSLSQFEINFINGIKPVFPQSNIGVINYTGMGNQEVFCLNPNDPKNIFSYGDIVAGKHNSLLQTYNLQLATLSQLQQAWDNGAEWIIPGWISDPSNTQQYQLAYPLQLPRVNGQTIGINEFAPQSLYNSYPLVVYGTKPTSSSIGSLNVIPFKGGGYSQIQSNYNGTNTISINSDGQTVNISTAASSDLFLLVPYVNNGALNGYMIVSDINGNSGNYIVINSTTNTLNVAPLPQPTNPANSVFQYLFSLTGQNPITLSTNVTWIAGSNTITLGTCPTNNSLVCQFRINMSPNNTSSIPNYTWSYLSNPNLSAGIPNYKPNAMTLASYQPINSADDCSALCQKFYLCKSSTWNSQTKQCDINNDTISSTNMKVISAPNSFTNILPSTNIKPSIAFAINQQNRMIYICEDSPIQNQSAWTQIQQTPLPNNNYFVDISASADPNTAGQYNLVLLDNTPGNRKVYVGTYMKGQPNSLKYTQSAQYTPSIPNFTLTKIKIYNTQNPQNYTMIALGHNQTNYYIMGYNTKWNTIMEVLNPVDFVFDQTNFLYVSNTIQNIYKSTTNTLSNSMQFQQVPNSCCVTKITFSPDNRLWGIGTDSNIYFKNTNDSSQLMNGANWIGPINIGFPVSTFILL